MGHQGVVADIEVHRADQARSVGERHQFLRLRYGDRKGFFANDVFAGCQCILRVDVMEVIRSADVNGVDLLQLEHRPVVPKSFWNAQLVGLARRQLL
jgi:hypothetical protein